MINNITNLYNGVQFLLIERREAKRSMPHSRVSYLIIKGTKDQEKKREKEVDRDSWVKKRY